MSESARDRDLVAELERARSAYERAREAVDEIGVSELETLAEARRDLGRLFDRYEGSATGTGDFTSFVAFEGELSTLVGGLPDDLPHRERFEQVEEIFDKRRLNERDFTAAREELASVDDALERLDERDAARERYRCTRRDARDRIDDLDDRIDDLERLLDLGEVDLDAPVEDLREPVETYDEAVSDAFEAFLEDASARDAIDFLLMTDHYPLVPFEEPPDDLVAYVRSHESGTRPIPDLLEYSTHSRSKLDHYVADPDALKRAVATHRTYLERIDAEPLRIDWPPPPASELRWRIRELRPIVDRFAPSVVEPLRTVRCRTGNETRYGRLRRVAEARAKLGENERRRLERGEVGRDLAAARAEHDRLEDALAARD